MSKLVWIVTHPLYALSWWLAGVPYSTWRQLRARRWGWATDAQIRAAASDSSIAERLILVD